MMSITEEQSLLLYAPKSNLLTAVLVGICVLAIGITLPFLAPFLTGWQYVALVLVLGLLLIMGGVLILIHAWYIFHHPALIINTEGICRQELFLRMQIKWEEIDAIYRINASNGGVFAVDLSPAGLVTFFARHGKHMPSRMDISVPQLALGIPAVNLPLPVDQLLAQIRERFAAQLEWYHIDVDDRHEESRTDH